jgi:hypothetical protein
MAILISSAFGLISFCLIVAVWLKAVKPSRSPDKRQSILDFSAAPVPVPAAPLKSDDTGQFMQITASFELKFPSVTFSAANSRSLRYGAPVPQRFRPLPMPEPKSPAVADVLPNIECRGERYEGLVTTLPADLLV